MLTTRDGRSLDRIRATVVYFVPRDATPLPDWRDRVEYACDRITRFHARELGGQSLLATTIHPEPFRSARSSGELRLGDATFTFYQTLGEVDRALGFAAGERTEFPTLLVLSDINWGDLDDFHRIRRTPAGPVFDGRVIDGRHFPGSPSGGARATYVADRGVGWALVSADGWRVPYCGSDCVVYHEGVGHAIGLAHPEPPDGSVMSKGQYRGWLNESWIDEAQKRQLGWTPSGEPVRDDLFSAFTAVPEPRVPAPAEEVVLRMTWPPGARVKTLRVSWQTELLGPWTERTTGATDERFALGRFAAPTPVSYRVRAELVDGRAVELWGYFQVRSAPEVAPMPSPPPDRPLLDTAEGSWRIELPSPPPDEYIVTAIVMPLGEPGPLSFALGRFVVALHECVDFTAGRPVAIVCTVRTDTVSIECEGRTATLRPAAFDGAPYLGAADCRYRFAAIRLRPIATP